MEKLFLFDGNSYMYRSFFAIKDLKTSAGLPTNAVYGFSSVLLRLLLEDKPEYAAVAFDLPAPTFRHKIYGAYKAGRPPMPEALKGQFSIIKDVIGAMGITILEAEGYEADDVIATAAKKAAGPGLGVFIMSQDKDCLQLVGENIKVLRENKSLTVYDEQAVSDRFGIEPARLVDAMALSGDASDNVPGASGVGMKTAVKLVKKHGSVEEILRNLNSVENPKLRESLASSSEQLMINKQILKLVCDAPVDASVDNLKTGGFKNDRIKEIFSGLEFQKFLEMV